MKDKQIDYAVFLKAFEDSKYGGFRSRNSETQRFARLLAYFGVKSIVPSYDFYSGYESDLGEINFHGFSFVCRPNIQIVNRSGRLDSSLLSAIGEQFKNFSCGCSGNGYMQGCFDIDMKNEKGKQLPFNRKKDKLNLYVRDIFFYFLSIQEAKKHKRYRKI